MTTPACSDKRRPMGQTLRAASSASPPARGLAALLDLVHDGGHRGVAGVSRRAQAGDRARAVGVAAILTGFGLADEPRDRDLDADDLLEHPRGVRRRGV